MNYSNMSSMIYLLQNAELKGLMKVECSCAFLLSTDSIQQTYLYISFVNSERVSHN